MSSVIDGKGSSYLAGDHLHVVDTTRNGAEGSSHVQGSDIAVAIPNDRSNVQLKRSDEDESEWRRDLL